MKNFKFRLQALCFALLCVVSMSAQEKRYVVEGGAGAKNGSSWSNAYANIQDAINDLVNNNLTGEVWVKAGDYYPTETTEASNSPYYKSFKIPAGITVRGGFAGDETSRDQRVTVADKNFGAAMGRDAVPTRDLDGEKTKSGVYANKTVLHGDIDHSKKAEMTWNPNKNQFDAMFFGNSYHVVWFAMNGFSSTGRANPLTKPAKLEGCVVEGGHAYTRDAISAHPHEGYGGGIYMVANSFVYNCEVLNCDASRDGGGIYMDGGGIVRRTLVHNCQALGLGTEYGFGGGICENGGLGTAKSNPIVVAQSVVTNCVGRMGGGMALLADATSGNNKYAVVANSTLVNNNTAQIEAGGVYTYKGGGLASMTIVKNKCVGSGITQNGQITGRSGGVYSRDAAYIGNTVIWGNECEANKDIQYADSRSSLSNTEKTKFFYNALSKAEIADWSKAEKMGVLSLDDENSTTVANKGNKGYPLFENPVAKAGYFKDYFTGYYDWKVYSESALHHAGINTADLDYEGLTPAPQGEAYDMQFGVFNSRCTMGAIISEEPSIQPNTETTGEAHFFVDPNYNFATHHGSDAKGSSWDLPTRFLGNVLEYIKDANNASVLSGRQVFIHVKEGNVDNTDSYQSGRVRCTSLSVPSNVTLLGSYSSQLTGTDLSKRNPVATPTVISGKLLDNYKYNIAHLITIEEESENITIDGFQLRYANASSSELANTNLDGAAITIKKSTTNISFKNIIVANCQANHGAAVFADASTANFENCIFHNNANPVYNNSGIVYGVNGSNLTFDHCDVVRNVGHASYLDSETHNTWTNSIFYGNMNRSMPDTNADAGGGIEYALAAFSGTTANAGGNHCMFDSKSAQFAGNFGGNDTGNAYQYDLKYAFVDGAGEGYPRFINPTKNAGVTEDGDATYYGRAVSYEPHNNNPVVNMASTNDVAHTSGSSSDCWGTDIVNINRDFGGLPDIGAVENHKTESFDEDGNQIENAYLSGQPEYGAVMYVRDYNTYNDNGTIKTQDLSIVNRDGSSWDRAINGNALYAYEPGTIESVEYINTYVKPSVDNVPGRYGFKLKINGYYLVANKNNGTVTLTNNENNATIWSMSSSQDGDAMESFTAGSPRYFWVKDDEDTERTYLKLAVTRTAGTVSLGACDETANIKLTSTSGKLTLSRAYSTTRSIYIRVDGGKFACSNNGTSTQAYVTATGQRLPNKQVLKETYYKGATDATTDVATESKKIKETAANSRVATYSDLHVYRSLSDFNTISTHSDFIVSYNIANLGYKTVTVEGENVEVDGDPMYLAGTSTLSLQTTKATSGKYVLINAKNEVAAQQLKYRDLVYIYDINNKKYVSIDNTTIALTSDAQTIWCIKQSSRDNRLNIVASTFVSPEDEVAAAAEGWNWTGSALNFATRSGETAQWVLENDNAYEVYNITEGNMHGTVNINGLQYAVNLANKNLNLVDVAKSVDEVYRGITKRVTHTYQNLPEGKKDAEVWVGAGKYTNYSLYDEAGKNFPYDKASKYNPTGYLGETDAQGKNPGYGYLIRNHVKVYGAFPGKGNPGMDERRPQLNDGIAMSKANEAEGLKVSDYETILQTQETLSETYKGTVLAQPYECAVTIAFDQNEVRDRIIYEGAEWDGFTMQNGWRQGFTTGNKGRRIGGGGAFIYENVVLRNCVIRNNIMASSASSSQSRGGGIYCDGGIIENCYLLDNESSCSTSNFGAGIYMIQGTMFNSVIAGNKITNSKATSPNQNYGAGIFLESAKFYNNTIVNNTGGYSVGMWSASKAVSDLTVYNTIIIAANGQYPLFRTDKTIPAEFSHCYLASTYGEGTNTDGKDTWASSSNNVTLVNCKVNKNVTLTKDGFTQNPFENTWDVATGATGSNGYDYRISQKADAYNCVNTATEAIGSAVLPDFDMDYTDRVQDCHLDIGAYEYNGAGDIYPQYLGADGKTKVVEIANAKQLVFYVTPDGYGSTSANDPENAACAEKLQRVIDAAGRYKFTYPDKQVIVKVANGYELAHDGDANTYFTYYATRTTDWTDQDVRVWSIIVPRGVEVWGGYTDVPVDASWVKTAGKWSNTNNGFVLADGTDHRNITANPTYFDSYYYNKDQKSGANTYHVVTFTDRVYDINGLAYLKTESSKVAAGTPSVYQEMPGTDESLFLHMTTTKVSDSETITKVVGNVITDNEGNAVQIAGSYASNRAVIDGIFVSGGQADATSGNNGTLNINSYGGAALVNEHAYVRNCILVGNSAVNGGALALTDRAFVSGCLIIENDAQKMGGGIYVFEDGSKLSNGTTVNTTAPAGQQMDANMPHVFTSTIVDNYAQQGGGIWYTENLNANARFNSVAVWRNEAADQANVFGMVNPEQPTEDETVSEVFYPFSFSLIENVRASGSNNLDAMSLNHQGVRFVNKAHDVGQSTVDQYDMAVENANIGENTFKDFGYYGLTKYSVLCSTGMPKTWYDDLKKSIAISDVDILNQPRINDINTYIEIGARALPKLMPNKMLMLRLFVAHPDAVNTKTATQFMRLNEEPSLNDAQKYYSQMGSSFAYPFNFLQDAIDYITRARNGQIAGLKLMDGTLVDGTVPANKDIVRNLPFEIIVGKGIYYPKQSLNGETESVWAQTFAIPEGVTIIGGFNPEGGGTVEEDGQEYASYYGRYYKKGKGYSTSETGDIYKYVDPIPTQTVAPGDAEVGHGYKFGTEDVALNQVGTPAVGTKGDPSYKPESDDYMPARTVKFQQWHIQDIADRRAMADNNKNGIIEPWEFTHQTIISGNAVNGETDGVYHVMTAVADADAVGNLPKVQSLDNDWTETGYKVREEGQQIRLNGLVVTGGNALTYLSTALDSYGSYIFYQGAGLQVDGNRYKNAIDAPSAAHTAPEFHNSQAYGVGYRDIPVSITNCQFRNNIAGYGGAISTNGSLSLFSSSFEQNIAVAATEKPEQGETWTGIDGAKVTEVNYPGQGGAILATLQLSAFNTLFANNEARYDDEYYKNPTAPTTAQELFRHKSFRVPNGGAGTLRAAGGAIMMGSAAQHHIVNCDFVRNKANAYPAVFTMNPTKQQDDAVDTHSYSQIINTVAWGNEVNKISDNANYIRASKLMVNIGKKNRTQGYIESTTANDFYVPIFADDYVPSAEALEVTDADANGNWQEAVWFCAYEEGVGFKQNNTNDLREAIVYSAGTFAPKMIKDANNQVYQNCNILIVADNDDVAGPNFGYPSVKAGYDGFTEGADWSPSRFNRLTDNGNGWIKQTVDNKTLNVTFNNNEALGTGYQGAYPYTHYISDIVADKFPEYKLWLAIGSEKYMEATSDKQTEDIKINGTPITRQMNLPRISPDPTIGVTKAYIDIGVYEYQKQPLARPGSEVDILWVSTKEHPENGPANGTTWKTPTSDLQKAIETLLSSRNGHKKEIRIMEGEYTPVIPQTVNGTRFNAFVIDTKSLNTGAYAPSSTTYTPSSEESYAQSLTIKGGYSSEIPYAYDPVKYKTTIRQDKAVDGVNTDYLIYVADPTVRYIRDDDYTEANKFGAIAKSATIKEAQTPKAMPIQFDGITLINENADKDINGSAIYYPDYTDASGVDGAHSVSVGGTVVYYKDEDEFKKYDAKGNHTGEISTVETDFAVIVPDNAIDPVSDVKMIISKLQVVNSGNAEDKVVTTSGSEKYPSAVYIGQQGGSALIYNTVFHSNKAMPLDAWNTVNVNNTFGLNGSFARLQDVADPVNPETHAVIKEFIKSQMHNTALWKNNETSKDVYGAQVLFGESAPDVSDVKFSFNSYTGGPATETNGNTALADDNSNIGEGPNFVDPENVDIESRNYDIKPSIRLLNKGNGLRWQVEKQDPKYPTDPSKKILVDEFSGTYANLVTAKHYDFALASTFDKDVLYRTRIVSQADAEGKQHIDIGAYEFQGNLFRVLYVDPNKSHSDEATGENWDKAFGYGDLQDAEDLAAIYHMSTPQEEAYVFVKGNSATNTDMNTNETLTIRDGVTTYGSIISSYNEWHGDAKHASGDIDDYIEDMTSQREGVASNAASKTIVTGIKTDNDASYDGTPEVGGHTYETPALVDGFVVTNPNSTSTPVLDITSEAKKAVIAVRNVVVADNNVTGGANVAQISNGLLYEALIRDNKTTGAALKVSNNPDVKFDKDHPENTTTRGFAVNVTVEGTTVGADGKKPVDGMIDDVNVESATQIFKSITNSINGSVSKPNAKGAVAPYGAIINPGISGYFYNIDDANLNYQLTETSKYIDMCALDVETEGEYKGYPNFLPDNLKKFINYTTDRDILGNPRLLSGLTNGKGEESSKTYLDRGAFETWRVDNNFICGSEGTIKGQTGYDDDDDHAVIKKHFYPHDGSVVYVMENMNLVIDPVNEEHEVKPTPENPGYLLVQEGANFYGNGRAVTAAYVAIERKVRKGGSIVAVPYAMDFDQKQSVMKVGLDVNNDRTLAGQIGTAYKYSGDERMDWKYIFQTTDTKCWDPISESKASQGVLYDGSKFFAGGDDDNTTAVLRFTGKGANLTDYVYREDGVSKDVTLTKYDDAESTNNGADFTDNLDMGWNCFGIPYLVSNYKPYETATTAEHGSDNNGKYMMNIPHTLWLYYDGKVDASGDRVAPDGTKVNGDGGYYSVKSWSSDENDWHVGTEAKKALWVGEGIFTQTATLQDSETLKFYRPIAPKYTAAKQNNVRYFYDATGIVEIDDNPAHAEDGYGVADTEYYTVNGMKLDKPHSGVVIIRQTLTNGNVRTIKRTFK